MDFLNISAMYVGIFSLVLMYLSAKVSYMRHQLRIAIGDAGDLKMLRAMRVQQNFTEYVPIFLIGLVVLEMTGYHDSFIHFLGLAMLVGRIFHAVGLGHVEHITNKGRKSVNVGFRVAGMSLTYLSLFTQAILLIMQV